MGFARVPTVCAFVARASSSGRRQGSPSNRPVSDPSMHICHETSRSWQTSVIIHPSLKPRMTETPVQKPVHVAYSPIASMNCQWTINLHDGHALLQGMQPEEYIPPSLHTLCYQKPTMFHLGDDHHCPSKILLPTGDNGENLKAAANEENKINDDLYKFRALNDHQGPPRHQTPI